MEEPIQRAWKMPVVALPKMAVSNSGILMDCELPGEAVGHFLCPILSGIPAGAQDDVDFSGSLICRIGTPKWSRTGQLLS